MQEKDNRYLKVIKKINVELYNASIATLSNSNNTLDNVVFQTSATMSGPLLFSYVSWVLLEAQRKGIKRLYFLARDGYIMYSIAKMICNQNNFDVECRYLYCSRYAWRIPQYHLLGVKCIDKICLGGIDVTLNKIFDRARLSQDEKINICKTLNIKAESMNVVLSRNEISNYKEILLDCKLFMNYVYEHSYKAYNLSIEYLKQEGLFENIPYGIVDTGWTGSMQESLYTLLKSKEENIESPYGFYYGLYDIPSHMEEEKYLTFSFSKRRGLMKKVYFNNNVLECICCSRDGMTTGYKDENNKIVPIMETKSNKNNGVWDVEMQINSIISFAKNAVREVDLCNYEYNKQVKLVYKLCKLFMVYPTYKEAATYSKFMFSDDITEKNVCSLGINMTKEELNSNLVWNRVLTRLNIKKINENYKESCWLEGSIAISDIKSKRWYLLNAQLFKWIRYIRLKKL